MAEKQLKSIKFQGLNTTYVIPEVDPTSTVSGDAADAKVVGDHINNQNNPHDVTIEQIGAAPDGFGYGGEAVYVGWPTTEDEFTQVIEAAYAGMALRETKMIRWTGYPSTSDYNFFGVLTKSSNNYGSLFAHSSVWSGTWVSKTKSGGTWLPIEFIDPPMLADVEYRTTERVGNKVVYKKNVNGVINYRLDGETTWKTYSDAVGAAPAGFGLGEDSKWVSDDTDIDSIVECGWYSYGAGNASVNKPYNIGNIFVLARGTTGTCTQLATSRNNSAVYMKVRVMYDNGIWSAWEEFSPSSFAPATHNHAASEITSGTLAVARGGTGGTSALAARKQLGTANSYNIGSNDTASQYDGVYYGWVQTNHYATPNTTNNYGDAYYTIVDSNGIFHIGLQLNQATSINWYKQYGENNVIYSSTQPSGSKGMIWLKPV